MKCSRCKQIVKRRIVQLRTALSRRARGDWPFLRARRRLVRRLACGTRAFFARTTGHEPPENRTLKGCEYSSHPFRVRILLIWTNRGLRSLPLAQPPANLLPRLRREKMANLQSPLPKGEG